MKPPVISISSSSDDDEGNSDDEEEELESEFSSADESDDSESDDEEYDEEEENDVKSDEEDRFENLDDVSFHQGSNDLQELSLTECKAYLRKHRLRLSGTKEECIQRIKEHERLKDGRGESLYPRSSFSINCTGDACKGDTVLFTQKVYKKFDKVVRRGDIVGKRTVAGRIVKESYGASKQQHTFTIEVLWSKGPKRLPPLSTLLVKGRNLYRFRTLRQPWNSEAERSEVLREKHKRGEAARNKRKLKKTEIASNNDKGTKRQKLSHGGPSRSKQPTQTDKQKAAKKRGAAILNESTTAHQRNALRFQKTESKRSQEIFGADPNRSIYSDHHPQKASSSLPYNRTFLPNLHPQRFPPYSHYNNGEPVPNHVLYRPSGHYHYNYEQLVPRYRPG